MATRYIAVSANARSTLTTAIQTAVDVAASHIAASNLIS